MNAVPAVAKVAPTLSSELAPVSFLVGASVVCRLVAVACGAPHA